MSRNENKPKKKHGCLTSLLVLIIILVIGVGGAIIFFNMNKPEAVVYSSEDVDAFYDKMAIEPGDYAFGIVEFLQGDVIAEGSTQVDAVFTSQEFTGGIQNTAGFIADTSTHYLTAQGNVLMKANSGTVYAAETEVTDVKAYTGNVFLTDVSFRFTAIDEFELIATPTENFTQIYDYIPELKNFSFAVDQVIGSTLYIKANMTYAQGSGIYLDATSISLNGIPVPMNLVDPYEGDFSDSLNKAINRIDTMQIETMKITEDGFHFKGTIPEYIHNSK